jgi:hypothetical protein
MERVPHAEDPYINKKIEIRRTAWASVQVRHQQFRNEKTFAA